MAKCGPATPRKAGHGVRSMPTLHSSGKGANKRRRIASLLIFPRSDETDLPPYGPSGGGLAARSG